MTIGKLLAGMMAGCCLVGGGSAALGQTVAPGQSVADRARPDYDPIGIPVGGYTLLPAVQVSLDATDNYLASNENRRADVIATVLPEARILSNWARHRLDARAYYSRNFHTVDGDENIDQFGATATGVYDYSRRTSFRVDVAGLQSAESRASLGAFRGVEQPVRFRDFRTGFSITHSLDPLTLTGLASVERLDFQDARFPDGQTVDQDYRDVRILTGGGSVAYDLRNGIGLLVSAQYQRNQYDVRPGRNGYDPLFDVNRESSGLRLQGGVSLELSKLILGSIQIGYLSTRYRDPRLRDLSGLSFDADVLWNPTGLTSVRFRARRAVEETSSQLIAGNTRSDYSARVDHELYRNIIVNGDIAYATFRPNGIGFGGEEQAVGVGGRYLVNRRYTLYASLRHARRSSDSDFLRYNATSAGVGVRVAF